MKTFRSSTCPLFSNRQEGSEERFRSSIAIFDWSSWQSRGMFRAVRPWFPISARSEILGLRWRSSLWAMNNWHWNYRIRNLDTEQKNNLVLFRFLPFGAWSCLCGSSYSSNMEWWGIFRPTIGVLPCRKVILCFTRLAEVTKTGRKI